MKFRLNAFLATSVLALNAAAQPAPQPSQAPRVPPSLTQGAPGKPAPAPPQMPDMDKVSYAIGMNIGNSAKRDHFDVNADTLAAAIKDVLAGRPTRLNEQEAKQTISQFQQAMRAKQMAEREKQANDNKVKGEEFLAKNAKEPGVTTLTNGLQYKVIKEGSGPMPKPTDTVVVSYKGKLIDGTVFDQNEHFTNAVTGRTVKGWSEVLPLMKTGSEWEVAIPADLGYGMRAPPNIGPNSVLIFDMELLSIAPPPPAPAPPSALNGAPPQGVPPVPPASSSTATPVVSGQIIKVPSAEEMKKGAKIEVITNAPNNP